jgi:transcriptional regulator with PAS, ATPase and Fis domain
LDRLITAFPGIADALQAQAIPVLVREAMDMCEGILVVDQNSRITWIDEKYKALLGATDAVIGQDVEDVIPKSLMRRVVESGKPILLDLMEFGNQSFVVVRLPLKGADGAIKGGIGFVLFDRFQYLEPVLSKFTALRDELARARKQLTGQRQAKYTLSQLVGSGEAMRQIKRTARRAAQFDTTVLLLGETGTGKELLAHAIHAASNRADKPFVAINAAAVPETLMEAEFFGVAPGAYTGADRRGRDGKFSLAEGGTLFLDEVGDMPLGIQAKLLRALQEREIEPIGSNKVVKVDVRVIAATSQDLAAMVKAKTFRADLYYRLSVLPITLPPLRDRLEDIPDIADALLEDIARKTSSFPRELTPDALQALSHYHWPGNVRELVNVLERVTMLSDSLTLTREDVAMVLPDTRPPEAPKPLVEMEQGLSLQQIVAGVERTALIDALGRAGGVKSKAARLLGLSRTNLYDKLGVHGLL